MEMGIPEFHRWKWGKGNFHRWILMGRTVKLIRHI